MRYPLWARGTTAPFAIAVSALNLGSAVTSLSLPLGGMGDDFGFGAGTGPFQLAAGASRSD